MSKILSRGSVSMTFSYFRSRSPGGFSYFKRHRIMEKRLPDVRQTSRETFRRKCDALSSAAATRKSIILTLMAQTAM